MEIMPTGKLRLMTLLSPGIPLSLYQTYQYYLEEALGVDCVLLVESRWTVPPVGRPDPFTADDADIVFCCSTALLHFKEDKNEFAEYLPVAPIHVHPKSEHRPIYFSEIIMSSSKSKEQYKEFKDLKGTIFAYNDENSLSGSVSVLTELKKLGYNSTFFGSVIHSGSHHNSIEMVIQNRADIAAIDSNVLQGFFIQRPELKDEIFTFKSLGPLPIQPVMVNSRLPADMKEKIQDALLKMNQCEKWNEELAKFNVWGFKPSDISLYEDEKDIRQVVKDQRITSAYY